MEHNAVMRPLHALREQRGITIEVVPAAVDGTTNPADFGRALEPGAALAVVNHASNVSTAIEACPCWWMPPKRPARCRWT
jgi:selenocysteine lyase/cysteine desulfurase